IVVDIETGQAENIYSLPGQYFGEGITDLGNKLFQITWKSKTGFVYSLKDLSLIRQFYYDLEQGWGLTFNGSDFIMSDGSSTLYFMDTDPFYSKKTHNRCRQPQRDRALKRAGAR
ncbi:MAG: glutaminyl-peptide cyclotransferase, partial [Bacteroidales bacterium]|nr:glutaminyl-peptide cyclotransferase [Bacteroidales bacterium]